MELREKKTSRGNTLGGRKEDREEHATERGSCPGERPVPAGEKETMDSTDWSALQQGVISYRSWS